MLRQRKQHIGCFDSVSSRILKSLKTIKCSLYNSLLEIVWIVWNILGIHSISTSGRTIKPARFVVTWKYFGTERNYEF